MKGQLRDLVCARIIFVNLAGADIPVDVAFVVDPKGAADRVPVVHAAFVHGFRGRDIVINKMPAGVREAVNAVEFRVVGPGVDSFKARADAKVFDRAVLGS